MTVVSKSRWLPQALTCVVLWGLWGFIAKVSSAKMSPRAEQILYTAGMLPLAAAALMRLRGKLETDKRGASFGVLNGVLAGLGQIAFYAALGAGPASIVTAISGLFPLVTVVLAVLFLRERLNSVQAGGIALALVAIGLLTS